MAIPGPASESSTQAAAAASLRGLPASGLLRLPESLQDLETLLPTLRALPVAGVVVAEGGRGPRRVRCFPEALAWCRDTVVSDSSLSESLDPAQ